MKLEDLLLGVLLHRPSTGYDLKKFMDTAGRFLRANTQMSQVYRSLTRMQDLGWVSCSVSSRAGAQDAKTYRVTPEGTAVFLDWLTGPYQPAPRLDDPELTARLSFAGLMTTAQVVALLDVEIATRRAAAAVRDRDPVRALEPTPTINFDPALGGRVADFLQAKSAAALDAHIAACVALRASLIIRIAQTPTGGTQCAPSS